MDTQRDPIAELVDSLERDGKPTLEWVVRWSADGRDPVQAAWESSRTGDKMLLLIMIVLNAPMRDPRRFPAIITMERDAGRALVNTLARHTLTGPEARIAAEAEAADAIRRVVPLPPTLDDVLTGHVES